MFDFVHISELTGELDEGSRNMKAIVVKGAGKAELLEVGKPRMRNDYILVKTVALAVNQNDCHNVTMGEAVGSILGSDFSGVVEAVGKNCKTKIKPGDKVFGMCHGANKSNAEDGAFAEFVMAKDGHIAKIAEEKLSFEEAATLGTGITTVGQALYLNMSLPLPTQPTQTPFPILIYGGSTATGTLAIQYAKLSGLKVVATCSPKNFDLLRSRGADAVFDYHDPQCALQIKQYSQNCLYYILDCISTPASSAICAAAFPSSGDEYLNLVSLRPLESWPRTDVNTMTVLAQTTFGEAFSKFGRDFKATKEHFAFGKGFWEMSERLLAEGWIVPHPVTVKEGGLSAIPNGILEISGGTVSGSKFVYKVA